MKFNSKKWVISYLCIALILMVLIAIPVVIVDPFFHYHAPDTEHYYYVLDNQRSQNDGISRNFEYDALITGTSMTENFKASEVSALWGVNPVKASYAGASYKEINDNMVRALKSNPDLKFVIRGLDPVMFTMDKDTMRDDQGDYPAYLYDNNIFNDVEYIFNKDVMFKRAYPMFIDRLKGDNYTGITDFDTYCSWSNGCIYGTKTVRPNGVEAVAPGEPVHITDEQKKVVYDTLNQNVLACPEKYQDVTFYYFFTPYSVAWWKSFVDDGTIYTQIEAEEIFIEEILKHDNIRLFSFSNEDYITADLNNFTDEMHYGGWVNSLMLEYMSKGKCEITLDNYKDYLEKELNFYANYDYNQINSQTDYEDDAYAIEIMNQFMN